jgi:hypothetical protein
MNYIQEINMQCQRLPENLQKEVVDFIGYLSMRYKLNPIDQECADLTDEDLKQATAILKAPRSVSLDQMDAAIKQRGGRL